MPRFYQTAGAKGRAMEMPPVPEKLKPLHSAINAALTSGAARSFALAAGAVVVLAAALNAAVILKASYTEIDWVAYMQEVEQYLQGERDYSKMNPCEPWHPLVYPAGFVYSFAALHELTGWKSASADPCTQRDRSDPAAMRMAQWIFAAMHVTTLGLVAAVYAKASRSSPRARDWRAPNLPAACLLLLLCSKRVLSIFVLRMFNDCAAMCLFFAAVLLLVQRRWKISCACYSLAVSIKMNILLTAPALLLILVLEHGALGAVAHIAICAAVQLGLAWPFLSTHPEQYLRGAFDVSRQFTHKWSVNFKWLPPELFSSNRFAIFCLIMHLCVLWQFVNRCWCGKHGGLLATLRKVGWRGHRGSVSEYDMCLWLFTANLAGMVFARSLHFQFYVWYFFTLPFLLWSCGDALPLATKLLIFGAIEACWNPWDKVEGTSTKHSSLLLCGMHFMLLLGVYHAPQSKLRFADSAVEDKAKKA